MTEITQEGWKNKALSMLLAQLTSYVPVSYTHLSITYPPAAGAPPAWPGLALT